MQEKSSPDIHESGIPDDILKDFQMVIMHSNINQLLYHLLLIIMHNKMHNNVHYIAECEYMNVHLKLIILLL